MSELATDIMVSPVLAKGKPAFPEKVGAKGHDSNGIPQYWVDGKRGAFFNNQRGTYLWYAINEGRTFESPVQCPHCRWIDDIDGFDVMGSEDGVFCLNCHRELVPTGINRISRCIVCGDWINTENEAYEGVYCKKHKGASDDQRRTNT